MAFSIHGNIKNLVDEADIAAENLNEEKLDTTMNKIRNYFSSKPNPLYRRFLRLRAKSIVDKYDSIKSCMEEESYLMDLAGK